jgi:abortive infection bacteriophage resistance protein
MEAHPEGLLFYGGLKMKGPKHNPPKKVTYTKPPLTLQAQLEQLKQRGMQVGDDTLAIHYLGELNYYRLGAYWLPFENDHATHRFRPNTSFEQVINLYDFDRGLRLLIIDAVERIEVSIRTKLAYALGHKYGPHPHLNASIFFDPIEYGRSISKLDQEVKRSSEEFIKHLTKKYEELLPPIWAVVELMTIGQLSKWYNNLGSRHDRKAIADTYDIDEKNLRSFLHHLCTVRNLCAHHSRVWNREYTFIFSIPNKRPHAALTSFNNNERQTRKIYNTLVMLAYMMDRISPNHHWKGRLKALISDHVIDIKAMGFPVNWQSLPIWQQ